MHPAGHQFEIVEADARRIKRLRLRLAPGQVAPSAGPQNSRWSGRVRVQAAALPRRHWARPGSSVPPASVRVARSSATAFFGAVGRLFWLWPLLFLLARGAGGTAGARPVIGWIAGRGVLRRSALLDQGALPG
jgi:hypothetical protein